MIFGQKSNTDGKINYLTDVHKIEKLSVTYGLQYVKMFNYDKFNSDTITLCCIMIANKFIADYEYNLDQILRTLDIPISDYITIEKDLLHQLDWNLSLNL
jgi:hypothetical protein